jgi:hypothetical protein
MCRNNSSCTVNVTPTYAGAQVLSPEQQGMYFNALCLYGRSNRVLLGFCYGYPHSKPYSGPYDMRNELPILYLVQQPFSSPLDQLLLHFL